jgi:hypothetical protein
VRGGYPAFPLMPRAQGVVDRMDTSRLTPVAPRGGALRDDRAYEGLTPQQWHYARHRAAGLSVTDAYVEAYRPRPEVPRLSLGYMGAAVEANPKVQSKLRRLLFDSNGEASLIPKIDEAFILTGIAQIAITSEKDTTRLRGYELLGKAIGLFDRSATEATPQMKSVNDIDAELKRKLSSALNPPVIDQAPDAPGAHPASPVEPPAVEPEDVRKRRRKPRSFVRRGDAT